MEALHTLLRSFSLARRLALVFVLLFMAAASFAVWTYGALQEVAIHGPLHQRLDMGQAFRASLVPPELFLVESYATAQELTRARDPLEQTLLLERLTRQRATLNEAYAYWSAQPLDPRISNVLMVQAHEPAVAFYGIVTEELAPAVRQRDAQQTEKALQHLTSAWVGHRQAIEEVVLTAVQIRREDTQWAQDRIRRIGLTLTATIGLGLLLLWVLGWLLRNSVTQPLEQASAIARQLASGNLDVAEPRRFHDEPGRLVQALVEMSHSLRDSVRQLEQADFINRQAMEMAKAGAWKIDLLDRPELTRLSDEAARIYGCAAGCVELQESVWRQGIRGNDRLTGAHPYAVFSAALHNIAGSYEAIYAFQRPGDGASVWLHDRGSIQRDREGRPSAMYGVIMDVTGMYQAQEDIRNANRTLEQALDLSKAATWTRDFVLSPDQIHFSERAMRLLGFAPRPGGLVDASEMKRRTLAVAGTEPAAELERQVREILHEGQDTCELKYPFQRERDATTMWLHDIGHVVRGAAGEVTFMRGVLRDITRERMAEEAILAAMQEAEAASQAKGDFLANMSHEIRTPMNAIIGLSSLALKIEMPPRIRDYLGKIRQSGEHLLGIINDILDFSKIESGKMEVESVPFELDDVLDNVANLVGERVDSKGLELRCKVDPGIPLRLVGDPLRIGQVLINLVNNAVKFTQQGHIRLEISVQEQQAVDALLLFKVIDTGIGLKPEHIERLFISFQQADASTTRQYGGTGLGLAISKSLAQAMGGSIGVNSVYGQGSEFWFSARLGIGSVEKMGVTPGRDRLGRRPLPGENEDGSATGAQGHAGRRATDQRQSVLEARMATIAGARILLVEDNEINQQVVQEILTSVGLDVDVADNGKIAVQQVHARVAENRPYDLVLMDMQMPVMDGVSAARLIRETYSAAQLPIVAMTANAMKADRDRCQDAGMNDFVTKPIDPEHLWKALLTWVKGAPKPQAGASPPTAVTANRAPPLRPPEAPNDGALAGDGLLQSLRGVVGLDVELGLARTSRKSGFYAAMLRKFIAGQEDATARITQCLHSGDASSAERMAHTLKGVAGSLGASALQDSAARLETTLREGAAAAALDAALQETSGLLAQLTAALKASSGLLPVAGAGAPADPGEQARCAALQALEQIKPLLQSDDAVAAELWEAHAPALRTMLAQAPDIEAAINGFDFEAALRLLGQESGVPARS